MAQKYGLPSFEMHQRHDADGVVHLRLSGELDLASADQLKARFRQLKRAGSQVRLDLSRLSFIDCYGLRAVLSGRADARRGGWQLDVDRRVSRSTRRLLEVTGLASEMWPASEDPHLSITESLLGQTARLLRTRRKRQDAGVRRLVTMASSSGARSEDIARAVGASRATLWRRYRSELRQARHRAV